MLGATQPWSDRSVGNGIHGTGITRLDWQTMGNRFPSEPLVFTTLSPLCAVSGGINTQFTRPRFTDLTDMFSTTIFPSEIFGDYLLGGPLALRRFLLLWGSLLWGGGPLALRILLLGAPLSPLQRTIRRRPAAGQTTYRA